VRRHPSRVPAVALTLLALLGCGGPGDDAPTEATAARSAGSPSSTPAPRAAVADVASLGDGPSPSERWDIPVGLNVCGRFIDAPAGGRSAGVEVRAGGFATIEGGPGGVPTVGDYAAAAGIGLSTGELLLPEGVQPGSIDLGGTALPLGGAALRTGDGCGTETAEVQVWVYPPDPGGYGEVLTLVAEPHRTPFVAEGMAVVIAFAPASSLPTIPPSALSLD
jgi:hypothetical protein